MVVTTLSSCAAGYCDYRIVPLRYVFLTQRVLVLASSEILHRGVSSPAQCRGVGRAATGLSNLGNPILNFLPGYVSTRYPVHLALHLDLLL